MTPYLLLDFGTSSTKWALCDLDTGQFGGLATQPSLPAATGPPGHCEVPLARQSPGRPRGDSAPD